MTGVQTCALPIYGSSGFVNHDGKGLEFDHYSDHQKFTLSWTQIEKYIDLMIQSDRYLTDKEKEHRAVVQEAERQLPLLDGDVAAEYNALKEQYSNTLIGFELGGYFLFYDKDAITVSFCKNVTAPSTTSRTGCSWAKQKMALPSTSIS